MNLELALKFFGLDTLEGQDSDSLKKIYYRLAQVYHPDKGGTFEKFIYLQEVHLFLKKQLDRNSGFEQSYDTAQASTNDSSSDYQQSYYDLNIRFEQLKEHYAYTVSVLEKYENIFNTQINIINQSNGSIKKLHSNYEVLKNNLKSQLDQRLAQLKNSHDRAWYEYILPTKKLTQEQYIFASNQAVAEFNKNTQFLDEEFVAQMLKLYQESFQDLVVLLADV
jgi:curved DNA-binding protein CbpA